MKPVRALSRRSFLGRVAGGAIIGGAALTVLGTTAAQAQVTDADTGAGADQAGRGRGSLTDSDSGRNADRPGKGRGPRRASCRNRSSGLTDGDAGSNADAAGCGRGARRP